MFGTDRPHRAACAVAILAGSLLAGCSGPAPPAPATPTLPADHPPLGEPAPPASRLPSSTILATAGGETVSVGDVEAALARMPNADRLGYTTPAAVRELVETLMDRRLMARAARAEGLDHDPATRAMLAAPPPGMNADQVLAEAWLERELAKGPAPGEAGIERYYRGHPAEFSEPARVRVTRVIAADEATAAGLRERLARGETLAALRGRNGVRSAGDLWLQGVPDAPATTAAALALKPGEVSTVLPVGAGFMVMRAEEVVAPRLRPLAEVRAGIAAGLDSQRRQDFLAGLRGRLRQGVAVKVDAAAVSSFPASPTGAG